MQLAVCGLFICSVIFSIIISFQFYKCERALLNVLIGFFVTFTLYEFCAIFLFWIEKYTVFRNLLLMLAICIALEFVAIVQKKKVLISRVKIKKDIVICFVVIIVSCLMGFPSFGTFGMGQDEGVYQIEAVELIDGNDIHYKELDLLRLIGDEGSDELNTWLHYNSGFSILTIEEDEGSVVGYYHGTPIWPALLALSGTIFGLENMQLCQVVFWIMSILIVYFSLEELNVRASLEVLAITVLLFSPGLVYIVRGSLSEMFTTLLITAFIFLILQKDRCHYRYSFAPLILFSFFHCIVFITIPIAVVLYWLKFLLTGDDNWLYQSVLTVVGYVTGFFFMIHWNSNYTYYNYRSSLGKFIRVNDELLLFMICVMVLVVILISVWMIKRKPHWNIQIERKIRMIIHVSVAMLGVVALIHGLLAAIIWQGNCETTAIQSLLYFSGVISIPLIVFTSIKNRKKDDHNLTILYILFLYYVLFYAFLGVNYVKYVYYYTRYVIPFIPLIVVLACYILNDFGIHYTIIAFGVLLSYVYPDQYLENTYLDTMISWKSVVEIRNSIELIDSALAIDIANYNDEIVNDCNLERLYFYFESLGIDVYCVDDDIDEIIKSADKQYENIYYLTRFDETAINRFTPVVECKEYFNFLHYYAFAEYSEFLKLPETCLNMNSTIYLLKCK